MLKSALANAHPLYVLPKDPVITDVLIPALKNTATLRVMMGYFSSSSFTELAPGLATFLRAATAPMHMIIGPSLVTDDFDVLTRDKDELSKLAQKILIDDVPDEDTLSLHTLACLAWLIARERLLLKIAVTSRGQFHPKVWLFHDDENHVALHGSMNMTRSGLSANREQLTLSRDWKGDEPTLQIQRLRRDFDDLWMGNDEGCHVLTLPEAVEKKIVQKYKTKAMPDENMFSLLWQDAQKKEGDIPLDDTINDSKLRIPDHLVYETGDFAHQGKAVTAWESCGRKGILEMATGSGKTITSMICATNLQNEIGKLLIVVSAPYRPLIEQWCEEIREFKVRPINLSAAGGSDARNREIQQAGRRLCMNQTCAEILVVTNSTLCTELFIRSLSRIEAPKLLIADECHNLGAESFTANPPEIFDYRMGLSATPIRQYDEEGTEALIHYFGEICFSFTLEDAIGKCLTEYDYHVHPVELTGNEMIEWNDLTYRIAAQSWRLQPNQDTEPLDRLVYQRRRILETANGKLDTLVQLLQQKPENSLRYTLIYTTGKDPKQLEQVCRILNDRGLLFRQLTEEETKNRRETQKILSSFQSGTIRVLVAKRVLDEGVNIPQIKLAYILASTTVKREWIQRRGRLLRTCRKIGKTHAEIHDFVVLPTDTLSTLRPLDEDARKLVRSELERVWEFARLSRNGPSNGGPYETVQRLQQLANERVMN